MTKQFNLKRVVEVYETAFLRLSCAVKIGSNGTLGVRILIPGGEHIGFSERFSTKLQNVIYLECCITTLRMKVAELGIMLDVWSMPLEN